MASFCQLLTSALFRNYLTGPLVNLPPIRVDLSDNYLSGCTSPSSFSNPFFSNPSFSHFSSL
ncbi:unnamed protein product, partial [Closterium sp. NIES-65]